MDFAIPLITDHQKKEETMVEDWLANAYNGMSRREFLATVGVAGVGLAGFAIAATPVAGKVITTAAEGLAVSDGTVLSGGFQVPIYEARPAAPGKYPVVVVIPEVFGMHEHIRDVTRRFAREGFLAVTFEPYAREGGVLNLPDLDAVRKVVDPVPDARVMADLDAIVAWAKKQPSAQARPDRDDGILPRRDVYAPLCRTQQRTEGRRPLVRPAPARPDARCAHSGPA